MKHPLHDILIAIAEGKTVQYLEDPGWIDLDTEFRFEIWPVNIALWRIKPEEKVKKWRWVMKGFDGSLSITGKHYPEPGWVENPSYVPVQKVESTLIEVEE